MQPFVVRLVAVGAFAFGTSWADPLHGQDAQYWNNQFGTRGQLLGGLVVGSFVDLSATYYNPGAVAFVEGPGLIIGTDAWEVVDISGARLTTADIEARSTRLRSVPSIFVISLPFSWLGQHKLKFSGLTRYNFDVKVETSLITKAEELGSAGGEAAAAEAAARTDLSENWFGLTWAYPVHPSIGLGVTTYAAIRSQGLRNQVTATAVANGVGSTVIAKDAMDYKDLRLLWKVGAAVDLMPITLGLTVTTPGLSLSGSGQSFVERSLNNAPPIDGGAPRTELVASRQADLPTTYKSPLSIAVGAAYHLERARFYFTTEWFDSVDEFTVIDAEDFVGQTTGETISIDRTQRWRSVVNWGVGVEYAVSEVAQLYGAFFTDRSAIEEPISEANLASATWDILHVTAGTALSIGVVDFTVGASVGFGDDTDRDVLGSPAETADFTYRSFKFLIGFDVQF